MTSDIAAAVAQIDTAPMCTIDGRLRQASDGGVIEQIDPATLERIALAPDMTSADVDAAVASARAAFEGTAWSRVPPAERKMRLLKLAELIERESMALAVLETLTMGKVIHNSLSDIADTVEAFRWYAEAGDKLYGEIGPSGPANLGLVTREPAGVVAAITPWNFPLAMAALKVAPALAAGCTVVLKPSEVSSLSCLRLGNLALEAGIPPGVLNVISGNGHTTGQALALHPDVDVVAFTGSGGTARKLMQASAQSNLKRLWLELGGKTPNIVLDDVEDLDACVAASARAIFNNQGQVCTAASRLIVTPGVYDRLVESMIAEARTWICADPLDPSSRYGAISSRAQADRILAAIGAGIAAGHSPAIGGAGLSEGRPGLFIEPTVLVDVDNRAAVAQEEIFGPVLCIIRARNTEDAIRIANDSRYGLAASVWTRDLRTAWQVSSALRVGRVGVNCCSGGPISMPFGGVKQSGNGRDQSLHAFDKFLETKATWFEL